MTSKPLVPKGSGGTRRRAIPKVAPLCDSRKHSLMSRSVQSRARLGSGGVSIEIRAFDRAVGREPSFREMARVTGDGAREVRSGRERPAYRHEIVRYAGSRPYSERSGRVSVLTGVPLR
ncbi:hypothetical protein Pen01_48820 [Phytomonospora endophytica]|nr:hypothetical protein Pen01_48820 [Phytomonospora endophytica]